MDKIFLPCGRNFQYGFPNHPMTPERFTKTFKLLENRGLFERKNVVKEEVKILPEEILYLFHEKRYVEFVKTMSNQGKGYLDYGDTPAYKGVFEDALAVVSASLESTERVWKGLVQHAFNIAGGLHHAFPDKSSGFCVFNDVGVSISNLLKNLNLKRVLYVDIDAHHGDGVFYSFYSEPRVWIADIHQSHLFPGTGSEQERGGGKAYGTKLNIPLEPGASDDEFLEGIERVLEFGRKAEPEIILLQAGADGIKGDPLTQLNYSLEGHLQAVKSIHELAEEVCGGKLVVFGGGGYNLENTSKAWANIVEFLS